MTQQLHSGVYIQKKKKGKKKKTLIQKDTCIPVFIAVLSTIAKIWKQPKCQSTDDWIKKITHTHTCTHSGKLLSHKKEKTLPFATAWMDLDGIMLSEASQTEKDKPCAVTLTCKT